MISVIVLVENSSLAPRRLPGRHGLSLGIEVRGTRILYDFGPGRALLENARALDIDLGQFDFGVLSHFHRDHAGGLEGFLKRNQAASVYTMVPFRSEYYVRFWGGIWIPVGVRIPPDQQSRVKSLGGSSEIGTGVHILAFDSFTNRTSLNNRLYTRRGRNRIPDDFSHESVLVIEDSETLSVFNSCSHHGVIQTLELVLDRFPGRQICHYVGGFHTCDPITGSMISTQQLTRMGREMARSGVSFFTGHCTGDHVFEALQEELGQKLIRLRTGSKMVLDEAIGK